MKQGVQQFWQARNPRERRIIAAGFGGLLAALFYAYLWQPMAAERLRMQARLPQLRMEAAQMRQQLDEVTRLRAARSLQPEFNASLQGALEQAAATEGMREAVTRITPQADRRARVELGSVAFDAWVKWTARLHKDAGMRLESCRIEAQGAGKVRVEAVFAQGGA